MVEDYGQYARRLPGTDDARIKRRDIPRDIRALLELVERIELEDTIELDRSYYRE